MVAWGLIGLGLAGCSSVPFRDTAATQPRGSLQDQELADRFIAHWNQNAKQINSVVCQTVDVSGQSEGQSYTLDARLAYQEPSNFRLTGTFLGKHEADLGSNTDEVWFWMARAQPPAVYFCKRQDLPRVSLPMPFHPDDLIQILGSVPLDPERFRFERGFEQYVTMVSAETAPSGDPVVKRVVIDRSSGRAAAFEVWDLYGDKQRKLAEARILDYYEDPSGVFIPRKVQLRLPDARTDLTIAMRPRSIEINQIDDRWAANLFSRGNYVNSQVVDLGEEFRKRQAAMDPPRMAASQSTLLPASAVGPAPANPDIVQVQAPIRLPATESRPPEPRRAEPAATTDPSSNEGVPAPYDGIAPGRYQPGQAATLTGQIEQDITGGMQ